MRDLEIMQIERVSMPNNEGKEEDGRARAKCYQRVSLTA